MLTVIVFIIILGLLIFVHEIGHFLVARRNGIKAEEFGFGFPPRAIGIFKDKENKWRFIYGKRNTEEEWKDGGTIYSLNWLPLGGFVKIKGEDGASKDPDSFASKSAWKRTKVLAAGVLMNFILAWVLFSIGFIVGNPENVDSGDMIQIIAVEDNSPASQMGLKMGDEILKKQTSIDGKEVTIKNLEDVQNYISSYKGKEVNIKIKRGEEITNLSGTPRINIPKGQGSLGIQFTETSIVRYPWYKAPWLGLTKFFELITTFFVLIFELIKGVFIGAMPSEVKLSGPVEIFKMTGTFTQLGYIYLIQFVALLSVNLGIINGLPIPALDGGRILFVLIEKIKGSPVNQKIEQIIHTIGFVILITLMALITVVEIWKR